MMLGGFSVPNTASAANEAEKTANAVNAVVNFIKKLCESCIIKGRKTKGEHGRHSSLDFRQ